MLLTVKELKPVKVDSIESIKKNIMNKPTYLSECYSSYSKHKKLAYNNCRETHNSLDELGYLSNRFYCIKSHNRKMFTYYGLFERVNKETGEVETCVYYSTPTRDEIYKLVEA